MHHIQQLKIKNIVATAKFANKLFLEDIKDWYPEVTELESEQFPPLIFHLQNSKITILSFSSGKGVVSGAKSLKEVYHATKIFSDKLRKMGIDVCDEHYVKVVNMVCSLSLGFRINLKKISDLLSADNNIKPSRFCGSNLTWRLSHPKITCVLFGSGVLNFYGGRRLEDVESAAKIIVRKLQKNKKIIKQISTMETPKK